MGTPTAASKVSQVGVLAGVLAATGVNLLSVTGIADSALEWSCFLAFDHLVAAYRQFRHAIFSIVPFSLPDLLKDYLTLIGSFAVILNGYSLLTAKTAFPLAHAPNQQPSRFLFYVAFYLMPWLFMIVLWIVLERRQRLLKRIEHLQEISEFQTEYAAELDRVRKEKTTYAAVLIVYPVACLTMLLLFSDFAYKVFGLREIGGIAFSGECHQ